MQAFTKTEISWLIIELDKQAAILNLDAKDSINKSISETYRLRLEQYADISRRLRLALKEGSKRIEIK